MPNFLQSMLKRLTDNYAQKENSNIGKLLKIIADEMNEIETAFLEIQNSRDIDQTEGATLDRVGTNVQQLRGAVSDDIYRVLIKAKIKRNISDGGIETMIDIISFILNIDKTDVKITESWPAEPATIQVDVPASAVNGLGLTLLQFAQICDLVAASGVKASTLFQGTFEFSSMEGDVETDIDKGFADDLQTTGGTLGAYYDPASSAPLPL
ncbi:DUF2612 domain-containing protein [Anaerosolibacter sp.]|uniref:DUF2612 domain-containing protein n=1 Tax=Anaerosolibacter sp. TaxID=1872527 RepID=UPI0039EE78D4